MAKKKENIVVKRPDGETVCLYVDGNDLGPDRFKEVIESALKLQHGELLTYKYCGCQVASFGLFYKFEITIGFGVYWKYVPNVHS